MAPPPPGQASIARSVVNQANTIIGAGMLSFPKALAGCGSGLGVVLLLTFGCMSVVDQYLLASLARRAGRPSSFRAVCDDSGLGAHAWVVDFANVLVSVGTCIAYIMVAGDTLSRVVGGGGGGNRAVWIVFAARPGGPA